MSKNIQDNILIGSIDKSSHTLNKDSGQVTCVYGCLPVNNIDLFPSLPHEIPKFYGDSDISRQIREMEKRLKETEKRLVDAETRIAQLERDLYAKKGKE